MYTRLYLPCAQTGAEELDKHDVSKISRAFVSSFATEQEAVVKTQAQKHQVELLQVHRFRELHCHERKRRSCCRAVAGS